MKYVECKNSYMVILGDEKKNKNNEFVRISETESYFFAGAYDCIYLDITDESIVGKISDKIYSLIDFICEKENISIKPDWLGNSELYLDTEIVFEIKEISYAYMATLAELIEKISKFGYELRVKYPNGQLQHFDVATSQVKDMILSH